MAWCREHRVDGLVPVGGGSTGRPGKALSLRTGLPQIAVPTTYAGSEMTPTSSARPSMARSRPSAGRNPATSGDLRPGPDRHHADPAEHHQRLQRHRPRDRGALRRRCQPDYFADRDRRHSRSWSAPCPELDAEQPRGPGRRAAGRVVLRGFAGFGAAWRCTTSSRTCSAAASTCPTRRATRRCCRFPSLTMNPRSTVSSTARASCAADRQPGTGDLRPRQDPRRPHLFGGSRHAGRRHRPARRLRHPALHNPRPLSREECGPRTGRRHTTGVGHRLEACGPKSSLTWRFDKKASGRTKWLN